MSLKPPMVANLPTAGEVRHQLGDALREVELLRGLLRLAERAERYRQSDREATAVEAGGKAVSV
jgi:hypothetical protein